MPTVVARSAIVMHSAIVTESGAIGFVASALVLAVFVRRTWSAFASSVFVAFITYAVCLNLPPILILHVILLPLNGWRLAQELQSRKDRSMLLTALISPTKHSEPADLLRR